MKDCQVSRRQERAAFGRLLLAEWASVGGELCAAPLDWRGDPPLVANLVKTEVRLQVGAGSSVGSGLNSRSRAHSSWVGVLYPPSAWEGQGWCLTLCTQPPRSVEAVADRQWDAQCTCAQLALSLGARSRESSLDGQANLEGLCLLSRQPEKHLDPSSPMSPYRALLF